MDVQNIIVKFFTFVILASKKFDAKIHNNTCVYSLFPKIVRGSNFSKADCPQNDICRKVFNISYINLPPYHNARIIQNILEGCCGTCVNYSENILTTEVTASSINSSDFIFPLLATTSTKILYGLRYIPLLDAPSTLYITRTESDILFISLLKLYPLIIVCLLFAVISGFIAWVCETWSNKEEFPRPFLIGWFDGFWWSFVTMTTVGYGDKTPKSILARLFAVAWILVGIIAFGIFTGQITGLIVTANSPPPANMKDSNVGVLRDREYDAYVVAYHGGRIHWNKNVSDFESDVIHLIKDLKEKKIHGFLLDQWTLRYVTRKLVGSIANQDITNFFMKQTTRAEMSHHRDNKLAYGVLVKDEENYEYFKHVVNDNRWVIVIWNALEWDRFKSNDNNKDGFHSSSNELLFSPYNQYFRDTMVALAVVMGIVLIFGIIYELMRNRYIGNRCNINRGTRGTYV